MDTNDDGPSLTVHEFCKLERISRPHYSKLKRHGRGPTETHLLGRVVILPKHRREWREVQEALPPELAEEQEQITREMIERGRKLGLSNKRVQS